MSATLYYLTAWNSYQVGTAEQHRLLSRDYEPAPTKQEAAERRKAFIQQRIDRDMERIAQIEQHGDSFPCDPLKP